MVVVLAVRCRKAGHQVFRNSSRTNNRPTKKEIKTDLERSRAVWRAVHDGPTAITRPGDKLFEESVGLLHKLETRFEWLKENPDPSAKQRNWVSHPDQKDEPENWEKGVLVSHCLKIIKE